MERRTYVSIQNTTSDLMVFRDLNPREGVMAPTIEEKILQDGREPIIYLTTLSEQDDSGREGLLLIRKNGEIQCLDGINLKSRWTSPASTISKNTSMPEVISHEVLFAQLTDAHKARKRLLKDREDIFSVLPQEKDADKLTPHLLVLITSPKDPALASTRTLHVVTLPLNTGGEPAGTTRSVHPLLSLPLPELVPEITSDVTYHLQVVSGILYELRSPYLRAICLGDSRPKVQSQLYVNDANSFLPLSHNSVITASRQTINIYNRKFQSVQASMDLKSNLQSISRKRKIDGESLSSAPNTFKLVAYSTKYGLVHAIAGNELLAFNIDCRQDIPGQRCALGLLIDSLGCGLVRPPNLAHGRLKTISMNSLGFYIPGSDPKFEREWGDKILNLDRFVLDGDVVAFEALLAYELGIRIEERMTKKVNGIPVTSNGLKESSSKTVMGGEPVPQWIWPEHKEEYPSMDPRLVRYILSRIFCWRDSRASNPAESSDTIVDKKLVILFFPPNIVHWLIETGNFSYNNVHSALRHDKQISTTQRIPAGQIIDALADVDPELKTLFSMISNTHLDAVDLLYAIRLLMQSLELLEDASKVDKQALITNGDTLQPTNGDLEAEIEREQEKAATALSVAESYLGESSSIRGQALSLALAKLHACPELAVVSALRSMLTSSEIVSLIYLLRFELARGAWTSRYLDTYEDGSIDDEYVQENTILLVSGLLNCCIDAIGAGGWLSGDSMLVNGDHFESEELIQSLKLEVSAALEGIEEASYLKGLISEMVRYGEGFQKGLPAGEKSMKMDNSKRLDTRPITLPQVGRESRLLPFGLKSEQQVSRYRVGAGGEVQPRTARDIGRLKSRKVGKYSRERIVI
jgi:hypothetical protein